MKISIKKVAIVCALTMVISIVPLFAADTNNTTITGNTSDVNNTTTTEKQLITKHQYKYQKGLNNANCTGDCTKNCPENCIENQHKYSYLNRNCVNNCTGNCIS